MMRLTKRMTAGVVLFLILTAAAAAAQSQAKASEPPKPIVPLKVEVVFNEYEGAKKVSSLPYMVPVNANDRFLAGRTSFRMQLRVPLSAGPSGLSVPYQPVGTNIDCYARSLEGSVFEVNLVVERSSLYLPQSVGLRGTTYGFHGAGAPSAASKATTQSGNPMATSLPIFSHFSSDLNLVMHDGQTMESTMATDPISGRVLKVQVTLHVVRH